MESLKTAVIGTGNMGKHHVRVLTELSDLVGIADLDIGQASALAKKYNTTAYKDYKEMLAKEKPDAVSIAVPTHLHERIGCDVLEKADVLVEKPIAMNRDQSLHLIGVAEQKERVLTVGQIERFNPVVQFVKNNYSDFLAFNIMRLGPVPPKNPSTGVIMDLGIHDIDVVRYLTGEEPVSVSARARHINMENLEDHAHIFLGFPSSTASIVCNWVSPQKIRHMYVTTKKNFIYANYITQRISEYERDETVNPYKEEGQIKHIGLKGEEPLKLELQDFLSASRERREPMVTGEDAMMSMLVALRAEEMVK